MRDIQYVSTGEVKVVEEDIILQSTPIGSCIAIMAWHGQRKIGGMAHIMLPGRAKSEEPVPTKYAINAIEKLREAMDVYDALRNMGVCVVGGANVLKKSKDTVCLENILSVTSVLSHLHIPVLRSILGGFERLTASLDVKSGLVQYTRGDSPSQILWEPEAEDIASPVSVLQ